MIFEQGDPVLERQLLLFHPLKPQGVEVPGFLHRINGRIEIAVFAFEHFEFDPKHFQMIHTVGHVHRVVSVIVCNGPDRLSMRAARQVPEA